MVTVWPAPYIVETVMFFSNQYFNFVYRNKSLNTYSVLLYQINVFIYN